jgi:hypothetical protein
MNREDMYQRIVTVMSYFFINFDRDLNLTNTHVGIAENKSKIFPAVVIQGFWIIANSWEE